MQKGHRSQTYNNQRHQNNRPKTTKIKNQRQPTQHQRWLTPTYNSHPYSVTRHLSSILRHPSPVIRHPSPLTPHPSFFLLPFILQINNSQRRQGYSKGLPPSVKWLFIGGNRLRVLDVASAPCFVITVKDFLPFPR